MSELKVKVDFRDNKYPFFDSKSLNITDIGDRMRGRVIYISSRFIRNEENEKFIRFEKISPIVAKLENAKIVKTEKGTLVIKYEPNSKLYVIEIPSGYRGDANVKILSGECFETEILRSQRGSLGEVKHVWCNSNAEIQYKISGRTRTAGYSSLERLFGENLSGKIIVKDDKVEVVYDEELDKLLS